MAEEQKKSEAVKTFDELREKIGKQKKTDTQQIIKQIATRDKLERDYREDLLEVEFFSSPETKRMIQARKPTQKQMIMIMRLSAEAALYENKIDLKSTNKMIEIYEQLSDLAATLSVDKKLDKELWYDKISNTTLQNFIAELVRVTQQGPMTEAEIGSFR